MSDDRLRIALRELGDVPPAPDLASAALRRLERDRSHSPKGDVMKAGRIGIVPADRIDDPAAVRWVPDSDTYGELSWTADSRRLTFVTKDFVYFGLIDVQTLQRTTVVLTGRPYEVYAHVPIVPPDGRGFATTVRPPPRPRGGGGVTQWTLRYYDQHGQPIREVPIVGTSDLPRFVAQPFSADGRHVAMAGGDRTDIVDTSSGRVVLRAVDGVFAGWYGEERFVVWLNRAVRVVDLHTGRVLAEKVVVPAYRKLTAVWLAPVRGTSPPGAIVL